MTSQAIIIGLPDTCQRLDAQLDLLDRRPRTMGWVLAGATSPTETQRNGPVLGEVSSLETIVRAHEPDLVLITLPAAMHKLITDIRTRLRRLGVAERFMPTLEDQLEGIGPRSKFEIDPAALLDRPRPRIDDRAISSMIAGRVVLITGAGGTIGCELARKVCQFNPGKLVLVDRSEHALFDVDRQAARLAPDIARKTLLHDVVDAQQTKHHFEQLQPDIVFHAAAHKHVPMMEDHPGAAVDNNLFGTKSVADASAAVGVDRFVMISTDKAVNPSSIMGATKRLAELYVQWMNRRSNTHFAMVRFGNVLGSSGSVLEIWREQLEQGGPLTVTDPKMQRYFMTIGEAAALVVQSAALIDTQADAGEVFVLDMGQPVQVVEMARRFIELHGLKPRLPDEADRTGWRDVAGTVDIVYTGARPGEKMFEELSFDAEAMRPTRHPGINIWMLTPPNDQTIKEIVTTLQPGRRPTPNAAVAERIRGLVPEMVEPVAA